MIVYYFYICNPIFQSDLENGKERKQGTGNIRMH